MTEYEMADVLTSTTHASVDVFSAYVTLMIAYLVATYLVGLKLTNTQMAIISILFVVTASTLVWALYSYLSRAIPLADALEAMNPGVNYGAQPWTRNTLTIVMSLGILACLRFMWDIRHSKGA